MIDLGNSKSTLKLQQLKSNLPADLKQMLDSKQKTQQQCAEMAYVAVVAAGVVSVKQ